MMLKSALLFLAFWTCSLGVTVLEEDTLSYLLQRYNKLAYPGTEETPVVAVKHRLMLINIVKLNKKGIVLDVWEELSWKDPRFVWDTKPASVRIPTSEIWIPDVILYENPNSKRDFEPNAVISKDGSVLIVRPTRFTSSNCKEIEDDVTDCTLTFESWTYSGNEIDLNPKSDHIDLHQLKESDYKISNTTAVRKDAKYDCCPETYIEVIYHIYIEPTQRSWLSGK